MVEVEKEHLEKILTIPSCLWLLEFFVIFSLSSVSGLENDEVEVVVKAEVKVEIEEDDEGNLGP